jgi:hypothetical protein
MQQFVSVHCPSSCEHSPEQNSVNMSVRHGDRQSSLHRPLLGSIWKATVGAWLFKRSASNANDGMQSHGETLAFNTTIFVKMTSLENKLQSYVQYIPRPAPGFLDVKHAKRTAECGVCTVPLRARSGGCASWSVTGAGTIASTGTLWWLTVLCLSAGYERDSSAIVVGTIVFTIEYFVSNGAASFCLFIMLSPTHQPIGLFLRYPAAAFVIRLTQSRCLPANTLRAGPWS